MEAMLSDSIHGGTFLMFGAHVSQFRLWRLVSKGDDGPCGATLMLNPMMCIVSLCSAMCPLHLIDVILFCLDFIRQLNSLIKCLALIARVTNGYTYRICLDFVAKAYNGYLQEVSTLDFVTHGVTYEVKDDGSHRKEGGESGYRRQSSHNGRGW